MTEFKLPPLVVDYTTRWVEVDMRGDIGPWARKTAGEVLARPGWSTYRSGRNERRLIRLLEQAAQQARQAQDASMSFLLLPSPEDGVKAVVQFCPVDLAGRADDEAWDDLLSALAPDLPGDNPAEIVEMETKAGTCRRLKLRYASGTGPERPVGEHVGYTWVFPGYDAAVVMATSFLDILEAARWLPALDELARDVWLQEAAER